MSNLSFYIEKLTKYIFHHTLRSNLSSLIYFRAKFTIVVMKLFTCTLHLTKKLKSILNVVLLKNKIP